MVVPALVLILAAAMLLPTPKAWAVDSFFANLAGTDPFCQLSGTESQDVFKLPELGGSYIFSPAGNYIEGLTVGKARLLGTIIGGSPVSTFAVDLVVEGRLDEGDVGYDATCRSFLLWDSCGSADGWRVYTALSGTLTGLTGTYAGAVYTLSLGQPTSCTFGDSDNPVPVFQVGVGANTHNTDLGGFAPLWFELADPAAFPDLPAGPFAGEVAIGIGLPNARFPTPSPDLTGTWEGSIDCAGIADFTDTESFSDTLTLKARRETFFNAATEENPGLTYSVELSDGAGVIKTYCAEYANDLTVDSTQGTGLMVGGDPATALSHVFLKVRKDPSDPSDPAATLKARELLILPDGTDGDGEKNSEVLPDGMNFCKWTFTQIDAVPDLPIANVCPHPVCGNSTLDTPFEQCDDGNQEDGDGCSASCRIEPAP